MHILFHQEAQTTKDQLTTDQRGTSDDEQDSNRHGPVEGDAAPQASPHTTHMRGQAPQAHLGLIAQADMHAACPAFMPQKTNISRVEAASSDMDRQAR